MTSVRITPFTGVLAALTAVALAAAGAAVIARADPGSAAAAPLPPSGRWDYQIGGAVEFSPAPAAVSRDNADQPWPGVYSICYVNAFQTQPGDRSLFSSRLLVGGSPVEDPNWPGEYMLDTRGHRAELVAAFRSVLQTCAAKGFRAVEFDNLDSYERSRGGLTSADNIGYAQQLVDVAHGLGLAAAQKNAVDLVGSVSFDFAIAESCLRYSECGAYTRAYSVVLDVEYQEEMSASTFQRQCAAAIAGTGRALSFVFRDRDVSAGGVRQWCTAAGSGASPSAPTTTAPTTPRTTTTAPTTTAPTTTGPTRTVRPTRTAPTRTHRHWPPTR